MPAHRGRRVRGLAKPGPEQEVQHPEDKGRDALHGTERASRPAERRLDMDALVYFKEKERLCKAQFGCDKCPLFDNCERVGNRTLDPTEAVRIVEEWSKSHPIQTNGSKFNEIFGDVQLSNIARAYSSLPDDVGFTSWWDMPYEAPKGEDE